MTAAHQHDDGMVVHMPNTGQLARSVAALRARQLATVPDIVEPAPAREFRAEPGQPGDTPARIAARQAFADCSRGAHVWVHVDVRGGITVCRHCPVPQHQAAAVAATRRATS